MLFLLLKEVCPLNSSWCSYSGSCLLPPPLLVRLQLQNVGIKSQGSIIYLAGWERIKEHVSDPVLWAVKCPALLSWLQSYRLNPKAALHWCALLLGILFPLIEQIVCPNIYSQFQQSNFLHVISYVCNQDRKKQLNICYICF